MGKLKEISTKDLEAELRNRKDTEEELRWKTLPEIEHTIKQIQELDSESSNQLFLAIVEDGSDGFNFIVSVDRELDLEEDDVEEYVQNYIIEKANNGGWLDQLCIEDIRVEEFCRYQKEFMIIEEKK